MHLPWKRNWKRIGVMGRVIFFVGCLAISKMIVHALGLEVISVNPLFSALVASSVFLFGFLLNGVLADYKESEKLPAEIATALEIVAREVSAVPLHTPGAKVAANLDSVGNLNKAILSWIRGELSTKLMMISYDRAHEHVTKASTWTSHSSLKARLMIEMANVLKTINRIDVIRETDFVKMVYWLAYTSASLLCAGLIMAKVENIWEATFFLMVISFLFIFLLHLIADLDNPFGMNDPYSVEDVSLDILSQSQDRIEAICARHFQRYGNPIEQQCEIRMLDRFEHGNGTHATVASAELRQ
jgi:predicted membrane chloride channel (bestrophin family)